MWVRFWVRERLLRWEVPKGYPVAGIKRGTRHRRNDSRLPTSAASHIDCLVMAPKRASDGSIHTFDTCKQRGSLCFSTPSMARPPTAAPYVEAPQSPSSLVALISPLPLRVALLLNNNTATLPIVHQNTYRPLQIPEHHITEVDCHHSRSQQSRITAALLLIRYSQLDTSLLHRGVAEHHIVASLFVEAPQILLNAFSLDKSLTNHSWPFP